MVAEFWASIARDLEAQKLQLIAYLTSKLQATDWHAVQDAASDIRELDAKLEILSAFMKDMNV